MNNLFLNETTAANWENDLVFFSGLFDFLSKIENCL